MRYEFRLNMSPYYALLFGLFLYGCVAVLRDAYTVFRFLFLILFFPDSFEADHEL